MSKYSDKVKARLKGPEPTDTDDYKRGYNAAIDEIVSHYRPLQHHRMSKLSNRQKEVLLGLTQRKDEHERDAT